MSSPTTAPATGPALWHRRLPRHRHHCARSTRPRRPQTNGKVERFHRILLEEWAYIRAWTSDKQRTTALRSVSSTSTISTAPTVRSDGQYPGRMPQHIQGQRPRRTQLAAGPRKRRSGIHRRRPVRASAMIWGVPRAADAGARAVDYDDRLHACYVRGSMLPAESRQPGSMRFGGGCLSDARCGWPMLGPGPGDSPRRSRRSLAARCSGLNRRNECAALP